MRNRTYGGVRGRKTKVGRKLLRFPPTRLVKMLLPAVSSFRYFRCGYDFAGSLQCLHIVQTLVITILGKQFLMFSMLHDFTFI